MHPLEEVIKVAREFRKNQVICFPFGKVKRLTAIGSNLSLPGETLLTAPLTTRRALSRWEE